LADVSRTVVAHNRAVLSVVIDCCRYLATEMIAFRKKEFTEGKMFKLFQLIAKYNADAQVYLNKVQSARAEQRKLAVNFLSHGSLSRIVQAMRALVTQHISQAVHKAGKAALIVDSTQDSSKMETTVVLVRYIENDDFASELTMSSYAPVERLMYTFTSGETSGSYIFGKTKSGLQDLGIDMAQIVGQSYDGAGNMRGAHRGMKTRVLQENPKAMYIWCHAGC